MKNFLIKFISIFIIVFIYIVALSVNASANDVTSQLEILGQPFSKSTYARNVWDMQIFNGRIYLGSGNSSNRGPSANAGTDGISYYDINSDNFVKQYSVKEEQIDQYKVLNGELYTPGHDPKESWTYGNFYRLEDNTWNKYRNIPRGIHTYDIDNYKDYLFVALGTDGTDTVLYSKDNGENWSSIDSDVMNQYKPYFPRTYTLFNLKGSLYAASLLYNGNTIYFNKLLKVTEVYKDDKSTLSFSIINANKMLPNASTRRVYKMVRPTNLNDKLLYIAGEIYNDHQFYPHALYCALDINDSKKVSLPDNNALPMDIITRGNTAYVLAYNKISSTEYTNYVYKTTDGESYTEVLRFTRDTFACSFEESDGDFYFGLGCFTNYLATSTGTILKVKTKRIEDNTINNYNKTFLKYSSSLQNNYYKYDISVNSSKSFFKESNKNYNYQIKAFDNDKLLCISKTSKATTNANATPPSPPSNLAVKDLSNDYITFIWDSTNNIYTYGILKNGIPIGFSNKATYTDEIYFDAVYTYEIIAIDKGGNISERSKALVVDTNK